jgi:tetratricopeptide (TPR) repeat protein
MIVIVLVLNACTPSHEQSIEEVQVLLRAERYDEVVRLLESLLDANPNDYELNQLYGAVLFGTGNPSMSIWPLRKATESPEATAEDWLMLARAHHEGGNREDAIAVLDRLLAESPYHIEARRLRVDGYIAQDKPGPALEDVEMLLKAAPTDRELLMTRASLLLELERSEDAREAIDEVRAIVAEDGTEGEWGPRFCVVDATFLFELGEADAEARAAEAWERCLQEYPGDPLVVREAVNFFEAQEQLDRALPILRSAVEASPNEIAFHAALSRRLQAAGEVAEAESVLHAAMALPEGNRIRPDLIDLLSAQERYDEALSVLEEWIDRAPNPSAAMRILRCDLLVRSHRFEDAAKAISELAEPEFRNLLNGRLALERGEPAEALRLLDEGLALWPNNSVARVLAAEAAERLGDFDRAFAEYVEAARSDSSSWEPLERLGAMSIALRKSEPLGQLLNRYAANRPGDRRIYRLLFEIGLASARENQITGGVKGMRSLPGGAPIALAFESRSRARKSARDGIKHLTRPGIDLTQPAFFEALSVLAELLGDLSEHEEAISYLDRAVKAHPDFGPFQALRARVLERASASAVEVRTAAERALEIDQNLIDALLVLGRQTAADGEVDRALSLLDRAAAADPSDPRAEWAAVKALIAAGREVDADARLETLVSHHIEYVPAVGLLAQRLAEREGADDRAERYAELADRLAKSEG